MRSVHWLLNVLYIDTEIEFLNKLVTNRCEKECRKLNFIYYFLQKLREYNVLPRREVKNVKEIFNWFKVKSSI